MPQNINRAGEVMVHCPEDPQVWDRARAPPYAERSEPHHADFITISSEGERAYSRRDGGKKILRIV